MSIERSPRRAQSRRRAALLAASVLGSVALLGGCSSDEASDDTTTTVADSSTTSAPTSDTATFEGDGVELTGKGAIELADSEFGEILVQGGGFTVYLTEADTGSTSTCLDTCADAWPPLTGEVEVGEGVDAALLGTTTRPDGSEQITYNGHPLYLFSGDTAPGDTTGQGVGDVWYVVDAEGNAVDVD